MEHATSEQSGENPDGLIHQSISMNLPWQHFSAHYFKYP